jgi:hypothetical protein
LFKGNKFIFVAFLQHFIKRGNTMKKLIVAVALAVASMQASAGAFITLEGEYENSNNKTNNATTALNIIPGYKITDGALKGVTIDLKNQIADKIDQHSVSSQIEPRIKYEQEVYPGLTAWGRLGIGEKITNGANYGFYTIEPGITYKVTDKVSLSLSDKYKDAFSDGKAAQTNQVYVGGSYKATDVDTIGLKAYQKFEDTHSTGVELGYTRSF